MNPENLTNTADNNNPTTVENNNTTQNLQLNSEILFQLLNIEQKYDYINQLHDFQNKLKSLLSKIENLKLEKNNNEDNNNNNNNINEIIYLLQKMILIIDYSLEILPTFNIEQIKTFYQDLLVIYSRILEQLKSLNINL